ncbi:MAG: DUF2292 domain-containing protein [Actinobacteria bacterium]|nr:DUF2292 domain-containing protein [Actinomycetota bacterium]
MRHPGPNSRENEQWLKEIALLVQSMSHGCLEIIIQDRRIIQINKTEKIRLDKKRGP